MYTVDYFIDKFEKIPEDRWCVGTFLDDDGRCCVNGHLGTRYNPDNDIEVLKEMAAFSRLFRLFGIGTAVWVNDRKSVQYPQSTPKQRILAALRDIKAAQK